VMCNELFAVYSTGSNVFEPLRSIAFAVIIVGEGRASFALAIDLVFIQWLSINVRRDWSIGRRNLRRMKILNLKTLVILIYGLLVIDTPGFGQRQARSWEDASCDEI
jgi:hypothetical protein